MFFIFCSFSSSWKQQKEKGEILITIKYRPISCLVFVNNCKLYTTVNLCYFQEWIMIVELRASQISWSILNVMTFGLLTRPFECGLSRYNDLILELVHLMKATDA